jgi:peptide-methionine (R)-S-oxide reductase
MVQNKQLRMMRFFSSLGVLALLACNSPLGASPDGPRKQKSYPVTKTDDQWKKDLSASQYEILREKGTERAFSGKYWDEKREGTYVCGGCGLPLFDSDTKFKSGTGWPSFYAPLNDKAVDVDVDTTYGMRREEILCSRCGGHLGHIFPDGPKPTGLRYCVNSESLDLLPKEMKKVAAPEADQSPKTQALDADSKLDTEPKTPAANPKAAASQKGPAATEAKDAPPKK